MAKKDPRARHLRLVRHRLSALRTWSVTAASVGTAAVVAVPYAGVGAPDIGWAGAAGATIAMAVWRWRDYRAVAALPVPESAPQLEQSLGQRIAPLVGPVLGPLVDRPRRVTVPAGSPAAEAARRLNAAAAVLPQLLTRLGPHAAELQPEADAGLRGLRDLAGRLTVVERSLSVVAPDARQTVLASRTLLVARFEEGVAAYERLASAAAECVAALAHDGAGGDPVAGTSSTRLTEAAEALAGLAHGFTTVRESNRAHGVA